MNIHDDGLCRPTGKSLLTFIKFSVAKPMLTTKTDVLNIKLILRFHVITKENKHFFIDIFKMLPRIFKYAYV